MPAPSHHRPSRPHIISLIHTFHARKTATNFNRLDLAAEELDLLEDQLMKLAGLDLHERSSVFTNVLNKQLLYALKNGAPDFVELYLNRGASASGLHPSLSFQPNKELKVYNIANIESGDVPPFALAVEELYRGAGLKSDSHIERLARSCGGEKPHPELSDSSLVDAKRQYNVEHMERILSKCADGALLVKRKWSVFDDKVEEKDEHIENTANHILFVSHEAMRATM
jgi:hypothetical protein